MWSAAWPVPCCRTAVFTPSGIQRTSPPNIWERFWWEGDLKQPREFWSKHNQEECYVTGNGAASGNERRHIGGVAAVTHGSTPRLPS